MSTPAPRRWVLPVVALAALAGIAFLVRSTPPATEPQAPTGSPSAVADAASMPSPARGSAGRATVVVYDEGQPMKDRWVVFHAADGSVITSLKSGADGKASAEVHADGMITVAYGTSVRRLITILGVQPNDEVLVGEKDDDEAAPGDSVAKAKVKLPGAYPSAKRYGASLGVGLTDVADPSAPVTMSVLRRYVVGTAERPPGKKTFAVLGLAFDDGPDPIAYTFDWTKIGDRDGGEVEAKLPAWSKDWREHRFVLAKAPNGATSANAALAIVSGEDRFECGRRSTSFAKDGDTTLSFRVPKPLGDVALFRLEAAFEGSTDKALFARRVKAIPLETRLDLQGALLPRVSNAKVARARDVARPLVRWDIAGDPAKAKALFVQLSWPETKEHLWTIVAPAGTKPGLEVPALPASLGEWRPDARAIAPAVALVDASEYATYDDVRKKGIHLLGEPPEDDDAVVTISSTGGDLVY